MESSGKAVATFGSTAKSEKVEPSRFIYPDSTKCRKRSHRKQLLLSRQLQERFFWWRTKSLSEPSAINGLKAGGIRSSKPQMAPLQYESPAKVVTPLTY